MIRLCTIGILLPLILSVAHAQWKPGDPIVDARDGKTYRTVVIGTQVWMAENLNIGTMVLSTQAGYTMKNDGVIEKYCWENNAANCDGTGGAMLRGGFYEWKEAMQYWSGQPSLPVRGICPEGWHIPSNNEWNILLNYLGGASAYQRMVIGGNSGFDALLTGYRCTMTGGFRVSAMTSDYRTYFWTAEQTDAENAPFLEVGQYSLQSISFSKAVGLCVRCLWNGAASGMNQPRSATEDFEILSLSVSSGRELMVHIQTSAREFDVSLHDILGRRRHSTHRTAEPGSSFLAFDLTSFPRGMYLLTLTSDEGRITREFILE